METLTQTHVDIQEGDKSGPQRFRRILMKLGPAFIKIGQFFALRPDLLPSDYTDMLLQLVDRAPEVPWETMRDILTEDLGDTPENLFATIRQPPLAVGAITQVYLARTHQGRSVAVKIQRPDFAARLEADLRKIRWRARLLPLSGIPLRHAPQELIRDVEDRFRQELDFTKELHNLTRLYEETARDGVIRVPQPFPGLSSRRVLTTEYLPGTSFSELLQLVRRGDADRITQMGLDCNKLAQNLLEILLYRGFRGLPFHADPHPDNLIAMADNVIGLVDFGLTDALDATIEKQHTALLYAVHNRDIPGMYRAISSFFIEGPNTDREVFRREFFAAGDRWLAQTESDAGQGTSRLPSRETLLELLQLARSHDMRPPASILTMYRALLTAESVACHLHSNANLQAVGLGFLNGRLMERALSGLEPQQIGAWLMELNELIRLSPGQLQQLLTDITGGRFILPVRSIESEQGRRLANQRTRLLTLAIGSMSLALLVTNFDAPAGGLGYIAERLLWGGLIAVYIWIAVIWIRLR
ncbi:ABC1 kinase family protein [Candidatus Entotheonella palauensis]|uniref:ABC1 kinase family protein n=1 Tax=Candidatus Entotheonella palauensis TaxID=93172 RepID=UPI0015C41CDE|nr:AarF/UbiB family protein [Candidatus Entotheonella palauensis]